MGWDSWIGKYVGSNALNYEKGSFELLGVRGIVVPVNTWGLVFERLYSIEGDEAFESMFDIGKDHGRRAIEKRARPKDLTRRQFVDKYMETANFMGMGLIEVDFYGEEEKLSVTIKDSPMNQRFMESELLNDVDRPIHSFLKGVFHAVAEELFECEIESEEVQCEFLGAEECVIKCRRAE